MVENMMTDWTISDWRVWREEASEVILIETFKIMKGMYRCDVNKEIFFFKFDDSGRRGHDQNCVKRDLDLV